MAETTYLKCAYKPGGSPLHTFEGFKVALPADDVEMALGFFTEIATLQYRPAFEELRAYFDDIVNDMGEMTFDEMDGSTMIYLLEKLNHATICSYPVRFNKDRDGNCKMSDF
ncbi:MAG: hypothetical protein JW720_04520 [Sedimentisphaerales bacterium]|nr:hypothetical protein [Sedimentisphaerales bacterium]